MSWETAASTGFQALSAGNKIAQGNAQAEALAQEGMYKEQQISDNTQRTVGKLQTSFLQSGIALDDIGGTQAVIGQAIQQGRTDIDRTATNYNNAAKNAQSTARTQALEGLIQGLGKSSFGGAGNGVTNAAAYGLNDAGYGNSAYDLLDDSSDLDPSPVGAPAWTNLGR